MVLSKKATSEKPRKAAKHLRLTLEPGETGSWERHSSSTRVGSEQFCFRQRALCRLKPSLPIVLKDRIRVISIMADRKAVIKNADMSEDMQQDAVDCASQALEKYNIEKVRRTMLLFARAVADCT
jgi:hypothetical protein